MKANAMVIGSGQVGVRLATRSAASGVKGLRSGWRVES